MRAYKSLDPSLGTFGTDVFMNHTNLHVPDCPCFTGDCVCGYEYIMSVRKYICNMSCAFSRQYESIGDGVNSNDVNKFNEYCLSEKWKAVRTYHGTTGKLALAHDEWLELNNKQFALYPSV